MGEGWMVQAAEMAQAKDLQMLGCSQAQDSNLILICTSPGNLTHFMVFKTISTVTPPA